MDKYIYKYMPLITLKVENVCEHFLEKTFNTAYVCVVL